MELEYEEWKEKLPSNLKNADPNYNLHGAYEAGLYPEYSEEDNEFHLPSRNPKTGELLKRPGHPTFNIAVEEDKRLGYELYEENGKYYTLKPEEIQQRVAARNKYRRVDTSLFKQILFDVSNNMGWETSQLTDNEVQDIYDSLHGNVKDLYKVLLNYAGGDSSTITDNDIAIYLDQYGVIDKLSTPKTKEHLDWGKVAEGERHFEVDEDMTFSDRPGMDEKRRTSLEKMVDDVDALYAERGELTPVQKQVIFDRRASYVKQEIAKKLGNTPQAQQMFNKAVDKIVTDLDMTVIDGRVMVKPSDIAAYNTFCFGEEVARKVEGKTDRAKNKDEVFFDFYERAVNSNAELKREGKYKPDKSLLELTADRLDNANPANAAASLLKAFVSGELDVDNNKAAQLLNQVTIDLYNKWRDAKGSSSAENFGSGILEGIDINSNIDMLKDALKTNRVTELTKKINDLEITIPNNVSRQEKQQKIYDQLTPDERNLLESFSNYYSALQAINADMPRSKDLGEGIGKSLAFMAEFVGTGGMGWLKSGVKAGVKSVANRIVKSAVKNGMSKIGRGAERVAERMGRSGIPLELLRNDGRFRFFKAATNKIVNASSNFAKNQAFAIPEAALQSVLQPSFYKEMGEQILLGERPGVAFGNTLYDRTIENWSERVFVGEGSISKLTGSALNFDKLKGFKGIFNTVKGYGEEYAEELIGDAVRRIPWTGEKSFADAYTGYWGPDKWDTFLSVGFITGVFGGAGYIGNKVVKIRYDGAANIARKALPEMLADDIDKILDGNDVDSRETVETIARLIESSSRANNIPFGKLQTNVSRYITARLNRQGFESVIQHADESFGQKEESGESSSEKMRLNNKEVAKIEILEDGRARVTDVGGHAAYFQKKDVEGYDKNGVYTGESGEAKNFIEDEEGNLESAEKNTNFDKNTSDNEVPKRFPQDGLRAKDEGNGALEEIAVRFQEGGGTLQEADGRSIKDGKGVRKSSPEIEDRISESYAKEKGIWRTTQEVTELGDVGPSGNENDTYISPSGEIFKVNNLINSRGSISEFVEKTRLHNQLFPETSYELVGFTGRDGKSVYPIIKQRYIFNSQNATVGEIDGYMESLGFKKTGDYTYSNGEYEVSDLRPRNVVKSEDGNLYVINSEIKKENTGNAENKEEQKKESKDDLKKRLDSIVNDHIEKGKREIREKEEEDAARELEEIRWNISRKGIIVDVDGKRVKVSKTRKGGYNTKNQNAIDAFENELDNQVEQQAPHVRSAMEERIKNYNSTIDKEAESFRKKLEEGNTIASAAMNAEVANGGISISQVNDIKEKVREAYNKGKGEDTDRIKAVRSALNAYNRLGQLSDSQYKDILKKLSKKNAKIEDILDNIDNMIIDNAFRERAFAAKMKQQKQADVIRKKISKMMLPDWLNHDVMEKFITLDTDNMNAPMLGQYESIMDNLAKPRPKFSRFIPDFIANYNEVEKTLSPNPKKSDIEVSLEGLQEKIKRINSRISGNGAPLFRSIDTNTEEEQEIIDRAKSDGTYMKAPNGEPSNLNEKQWAQVRTKAFKEWFGDWENDPESASKVVDENMEPRVVYHGTTSDKVTQKWNDKAKSYDTSHEPFTVFRRTNDGERNAGYFFNSDQQNAYDYGYNTYDVFLNLRNPLVIDANGSNYTNIAYNGESKDTYEWTNYAEKNGYDGVVFENVRDGVDYGAMETPTTDYVSFRGNQIKSATDNTGEFSRGNDDIRFRDIEDVNRRFNEELKGLTEENANRMRFELGNPSESLLSAGIPNKPLVLYGNKLIKKSQKHGFNVQDIKDLPNALQNPIGVFAGSHPNSYAVLTEMTLGDKKVLVSVETNKDGEVDFNLVSSVFGKNDKGVIKWILDGKLRNVDKKKALAYISASAPIADATYRQELDSATNIVENFENPTLLEGEISSAIDELSDELGVKVNKVKSRNDLPEGVQRQMKNGRYPGLFDPKTGEVYMVMDEITDVADAQATMLHEIVGHKGIRGLFGDRIGEFTNRVLDSMPKSERESWVKKYKGNKQLAAEEYVARFAEGYENPSAWEKIKAVIRDLLREFGIDLRLSDSDLKYILWKAKNGLKKGGGSLEGIRESVKVKKIENALFREGNNVNTIEDYRKLSREVSRLKTMAAKWYEKELGKIDEGADNYEERVNNVNSSYQSILNEIDSMQNRLKDVSSNLKSGIIDGIWEREGGGMLAEAMEAPGVKGTPFEDKLKEIKRFGVDLKGFDNLELKDLVNLETALFNVSIGVPTQDIFTVLSKLRANEMHKRLQKSREKIIAASFNRRVGKLLEDIERLKDLVDIHDFSMVDALFDAGSGKDLYENFFVPQIESAVVRMDKEKATTLKDFGEEMQKLENFSVVSRLTNGTALQRLVRRNTQCYRDLAGMIMTQLDYESNTSVPFEDLPDELKDYFGYVINKTNAPKDLKTRTKDAYQFMRFGKDGRIDVDKTLKAIDNEELAGILRKIMAVSRKTLDGEMRDYYVANAVRRGINMKMMDNYFPRFVRKSLATKTDGEIDFEHIYSSGKLMPTTLPSSLNRRMAKAMPNPVEIDISRIMKRSVNETFTDYFLSPAFAQANSALIRAEKEGGRAANAFAVLRQAMRDRLIKNYRKELSKDDTKWIKDVDRAVARMSRTLLLAKIPKTVAEFASNQVGSLISDGTAGWSYWRKIDILHELADVMDLTSAKNIVKYNEMFRDATGKKMSLGEKGVSKLITINDEWTSSAIYYKTFNKLFEEYSGQKFNYEKARTDNEYRKWVIEDHNGERSYFERAHIGALTRAQESFTTVNRALGATHTKFLFGLGKMDVDSFGGRAFGFMMSFNTNERFEFIRGSKELWIGILNKDTGLVKDGLTRMTSRFVRGAIYAAYMQQIGNIVEAGLRDDKDPEWVVNPNLLAGTCINLALGRYGNTGGLLLNAALGALKSWDKKINGNTELTKSVVSAINNGAGIYAVPLSTDIPTLRTIEKILPHWGFMMRIITDSPEMTYDIYKKISDGKQLSDDEQMLWGSISLMNAVLTMLYPNPVTTTGFNVSRTVESSYKRDKYDEENSENGMRKTEVVRIGYRNKSKVFTRD